MTKYRTISNGYWDYLQYEIEYKEKHIFCKTKTKTKWENVWKPYCDKSTGKYYGQKQDQYINSLNDDIKNFVQKWSNIEEYFIQSKIKQEELVKIYKEYNRSIEEKKNKITYL